MVDRKRKPGCKAYQVSDQMNCPRCGLVWDMNDPEPPECVEIGNTPWEIQAKKQGREVLARLKELCK